MARVELPTAGVNVDVAAVYWQMSSATDPRDAIEPDVPVALGSSAFFRGRTPCSPQPFGTSRALDSAP